MDNTQKPLAQDLYEALCLLLDQVDYTSGACGLTEMVGACLDARVLDRVKAVKARAREELRAPDAKDPQ